jgi:hypothetical protein
MCPFNFGKLFKSPQSKQNIALKFVFFCNNMNVFNQKSNLFSFGEFRKVPSAKIIQSGSLAGQTSFTGGGAAATAAAIGPGVTTGTEAFFRHNNSCSQLTQHHVRLSQVNRKSAITKYSIDDIEASAAGYDSSDETTYLSKYDLIMNSSELFSGEFGLAYIKCFRCDARLEYYSEDAIGGLIVACSTIVHRECSLAAPLILDMIVSIMRFVFFRFWKKKSGSCKINVVLSQNEESRGKNSTAGSAIAIFTCPATTAVWPSSS